jgi:alanine-glyoxylate transaminase/serine-glyoxylate transaminase/serine-pyruvate transaminase
MIPGPVEFEPAVMQPVGMQSTSHVEPYFKNSSGRSLEMMHDAWLSPEGKLFIIAGSGTLAIAMAC